VYALHHTYRREYVEKYEGERSSARTERARTAGVSSDRPRTSSRAVRERGRAQAPLGRRGGSHARDARDRAAVAPSTVTSATRPSSQIASGRRAS